MSAPAPSYRPRDASSLVHVDRAFYERVVRAPRVPLEAFVIAPRTGHAWPVAAGHIFRVTTPDGPQVGDLNLWNRHDPQERLWSARTRQLQAAHVTTFDRLWSTLPSLRPMVTIIADTVPAPGPGEPGRVHDLLGTRCDPYVTKLLSGIEYDRHCQSNLTRAIASYGLVESDVHDPLNMFEVTGLTDDDHYYFTTSTARAGDYVEFFAEIDLLVGLSNCPGGDLSLPMWGPDGQSDVPCHPLSVEVFAVDDGVLDGWRSPQRVPYAHKAAV